jgi:hypothetical protein
MSYSKGCSLLSLGGFVPGVGFSFSLLKNPLQSSAGKGNAHPLDQWVI